MQQVMQYRFIRKIGEGGMGEIWLAEDEQIGRKLAIKILNPLLASKPDLVERFRQEARIQANLTHPNIVSVYAFFQHEDRYYLVMEFAEGVTLRELINHIGPIPFPRAIHILRQILETLAFTHKRQIIHRDIKPSNIMVDTANNEFVKVMDFGIAKAMEEKGMTKTGSALGTVLYMSPEQITDSKNIDIRTDIYSLGITFYEMLSGILPFADDTSSDYHIQKRIIEEDPPPPTNFYPHIPDWILPILKKMHAKDPAKRYQTAEDILNDLDRCEPKQDAYQSISPKQIPQQQVPGEPVAPRAPRKKLPLWSVIVTGVVILAAIMLVTTVLGRKKESLARDEYPGMILVQGGTFSMGDGLGLGVADALPVHQVTLSSYYISKTEITQAEWQAVMGSNPSEFTGANRPVDKVNWYQAIDYCNRRSLKENLKPCYTIQGSNTPVSWESGLISIDINADGYRLPTEAEWEYAAVGNDKNTSDRYSGSNNINEVAWYLSNSSGSTHDVAQKNPNSLGICDMSGNVWEWCWDYYGGYSSNQQTNPLGPAEGEGRCLRGGSWFFPNNDPNQAAALCTVVFRSWRRPAFTDNNIGFRVCRSAISDQVRTVTDTPVADHNTDDIDAVITVWNNAHNQKDMNAFNSVFADRVDFYSKNLSRSEVVDIKSELLNETYPEFAQNLPYDTVYNFNDAQGTVRADFTKQVSVRGETTPYQAYLVLKKYPSGWLIIKESDKTTDKNLRLN